MSWKSAAALLALTFLGVGSLVYILLNKDDENSDYCILKTSKSTTSEVKIPKESVSIVIGRGGNTLKEIESKADVKIKIKEDNLTCDYKICVIKGAPESIEYAEALIHEIIVSQPLIETFEMSIPVQACGRIIGKNGDNIRLICRNSNAKITIENAPTSPVSFERKITIKGTSEQIALAKTLVEQKLEEEQEFRNKLEELMSNRPPRNKPKYILPAKGETQDTDTYKHKEKFVATGSNGLLEVYVSFIESPDRFWLQMMGPSTVELDRLSDQMTDYYSKTEHKIKHKLSEVKVGQIVAAPFTYDNKWYRAEVLERHSKQDLEEADVLLYYVDYGNSSLCKENSIYELRTDFLRLRFQAIECMLAKVKPKSRGSSSLFLHSSEENFCEQRSVILNKMLTEPEENNMSEIVGCKKSGFKFSWLIKRTSVSNCGELNTHRDSSWEDEATEIMEDLTHVALWKSLIAKIHTYKERPSRGKREGSPIPCVELYDTHGEKTINVAEELVQRGFAVWEEGVQPSKNSIKKEESS